MAAKNINFRAGARERETFDQAAKRAGCRLSTWLRAVALVAADADHLAEDVETQSACCAVRDDLRQRLCEPVRVHHEAEAGLHQLAAAFGRLASVSRSMTDQQEENMLEIMSSGADDAQLTRQAATYEGWAPPASGVVSAMNGTRRVAGPFRVDPEHTITWHLPASTRPLKGDPEPSTEELRVGARLCWTHKLRSNWTRLHFEQPAVRIRRKGELTTVEEQDRILGLEVGLVFHVDLLGAPPSHPSDLAKSAVAHLVTGVNGFKLRAAKVDTRGTSVASFDVTVIDVR